MRGGENEEDMKSAPEGAEEREASAKPFHQRHHHGVAEGSEAQGRVSGEVHQQPDGEGGEESADARSVKRPVDEGERGKVRFQRKRGDRPGGEFGDNGDAQDGGELRNAAQRMRAGRFCDEVSGHGLLRRAESGKEFRILAQPLLESLLRRAGGIFARLEVFPHFRAGLVAEASRFVVVHHPRRLHVGVDNGGADKAESPPFQVAGERLGFGRGVGNIGLFAKMVLARTAAHEAPRIRVKRAELLRSLQKGAGVGNRRLHFQAVADDARIFQQRGDFRRSEARHLFGVEFRECAAVVFALVQDGRPTQSGLRALQNQEFKMPRLFAHRRAPFAVVICKIKRVSAPHPFAAGEIVGRRMGGGFFHRAIMPICGADKKFRLSVLQFAFPAKTFPSVVNPFRVFSFAARLGAALAFCAAGAAFAQEESKVGSFEAELGGLLIHLDESVRNTSSTLSFARTLTLAAGTEIGPVTDAYVTATLFANFRAPTEGWLPANTVTFSMNGNPLVVTNGLSLTIVENNMDLIVTASVGRNTVIFEGGGGNVTVAAGGGIRRLTVDTMAEGNVETALTSLPGMISASFADGKLSGCNADTDPVGGVGASGRFYVVDDFVDVSLEGGFYTTVQKGVMRLQCQMENISTFSNNNNAIAITNQIARASKTGEWGANSAFVGLRIEDEFGPAQAYFRVGGNYWSREYDLPSDFDVSGLKYRVDENGNRYIVPAPTFRWRAGERILSDSKQDGFSSHFAFGFRIGRLSAGWTRNKQDDFRVDAYQFSYIHEF